VTKMTITKCTYKKQNNIRIQFVAYIKVIWIYLIVNIIPMLRMYYRNLTLAKCGGEAQHFQSWGFGVLRDSRMFKVRQQGPKHLALTCSWRDWKGLEA
jgi:hypothetical protein